ncbi:Heat shock protein HslJ [Moraxella cuniculi DSM 21768]|uniref:Heat shock protein HslJ n=1 Tax=Moraxella cuniculi DSM 21768 TaxID=1122245 RepID=A0A1N7F4D0_9GAMM|nr:META domain-containing protein [Moraxella cuniculi]OOS04995.1 hypothetical protein B0189_07445 [Moraxella cuniculi]SIR95149.1 Heat shock protein HslJ [Moraxella cuniculi DSM 21768]
MKTRALTFSPSIIFFATVLTATALLGGCYKVGDAVNGAVYDIKVQKNKQENEPKLKNFDDVADKYQPANSAELAKYDWVLVSAQMQGAPIERYESIIAKRSATMNFGDNLVSYSLGCNNYRSSYQLNEGVISLNSIGATMMSCNNANNGQLTLNQIEDKFTNALAQSRLRFANNPDEQTATLVQQKGVEVLIWQGVLKNNIRFGEPVRLYWEIDPETVNCVDTTGGDKMCLKIRKVNYNAEGIKVGAGAWRTFYGKIHGFNHQGNVRQIIRLNAYNNPDGKENPYYVFDSIVESEIINAQ